MRPEALIRDAFAAFNARDQQNAFSVFADDLVVNNFVQRPINLKEFIALNLANLAAFPDWHFEIKQIETEGDKMIVNLQSGGTQNGAFNVPGMPSMPATGKQVTLPGRLICTLGEDNKVHRLDFDQAPGAGFADILQQLGIS